jgi:hypothetical protein
MHTKCGGKSELICAEYAMLESNIHDGLTQQKFASSSYSRPSTSQLKAGSSSTESFSTRLAEAPHHQHKTSGVTEGTEEKLKAFPLGHFHSHSHFFNQNQSVALSD